MNFFVSSPSEVSYLGEEELQPMSIFESTLECNGANLVPSEYRFLLDDNDELQLDCGV